jgi:MraZ protein
MARFRGDYPCKVDVKGRIILPVAFKKQMPSDSGDHFVVQKDIFVNCLVLRTIEDWEKELDMIRKRLSPYNREHNMFLRNYFKGIVELSLDNNNRILLSKRFLDMIGADRDVILLGQDEKIEIWAADEYEKINMPNDEYGNLAEKLLGKNINETEI